MQPVAGGGAAGVAVALAMLTLLALGLRIAAAQGGLWMDEAWSAEFAREAGTPAGVFFAINHDNNHFLNTLWLQATGWGAPPPLSRALSIASGTLAVPLGGWIALRWSWSAALATAALLAVSPILLVYGAEARGYAPMLLALLALVALVDRWLAGRPLPATPALIGLATGIGMLAHLTMLFGLAVVSAWAAATSVRRTTAIRALLDTVELMRWGIAAAGVVVALVVIVAVGNGGYRIGSVWPFTARGFVDGVGAMFGYAFGWPAAPSAVLIGAAALATAASAWAAPALRERAPLYLLAIVLLPAAVGLLRLGNSGFPRYFLVSAVVALLFAGDLFGVAWRWGGGFRALGSAALAATCLASAAVDARLIADRRGDPGEAVAAMRAKAPRRATAMTAQSRSAPVLASAAASAGYELTIVADACPPAPFLYVDEDGWASMPERLVRCGLGYRRVAGRSFTGLSGLTWSLYRAQEKP